MVLSTIEYELKQFKIFSGMNEFESVRLNNDKTIFYHKKGEVIYREGSRLDGLYCILDGIVKIYKNGPNGRQPIICLAKKGDIIAYRSLLSNETACTSAKVISDAVLCHVPYSLFLYLMDNNPIFSGEIVRVVCRELRSSNDYMINIVHKSVRERAAEILLYLLEKFGLDGNKFLQIRITKTDIANMIGTVPESLMREFSEFRKEGLIESVGRNIKILNLSGLEKIAKLNI